MEGYGGGREPTLRLGRGGAAVPICFLLDRNGPTGRSSVQCWRPGSVRSRRLSAGLYRVRLSLPCPSGVCSRREGRGAPTLGLKDRYRAAMCCNALYCSHFLWSGDMSLTSNAIIWPSNAITWLSPDQPSAFYSRQTAVIDQPYPVLDMPFVITSYLPSYPASYHIFQSWHLLEFQPRWYVGNFLAISWPFLGYLWLSLPIWLPLAIFGYLWLPLATFGYLWLSLAIFGYLWLSLGIYGYLWLSLAIFGNLWLSLAIFGYLWLSLAIFGYLWQSLAIFGYLWIYLAKFDYMLVFISPPPPPLLKGQWLLASCGRRACDGGGGDCISRAVCIY